MKNSQNKYHAKISESTVSLTIRVYLSGQFYRLRHGKACVSCHQETVLLLCYLKQCSCIKIIHNLTPPYLSNIFKFSSEVHNKALRSTTANLLYVPKPNIEIYRKRLAYSGSKIWNSIPEHIRNANSLQQFRKGYLEWAANEDHSSL